MYVAKLLWLNLALYILLGKSVINFVTHAGLIWPNCGDGPGDHTWLLGGLFLLVALVWLFSTVCFKCSLKSPDQVHWYGDMVTHEGLIWPGCGDGPGDHTRLLGDPTSLSNGHSNTTDRQFLASTAIEPVERYDNEVSKVFEKCLRILSTN